MQNKILLSIALFALIFALPQDAAAQRCPPTQVSCAGQCQRPATNQGEECPGDGGQVGTINSCGVCTNLRCPDDLPVTCNGVCSERFEREDQACETATEAPGEWNQCGDCVATGACASGQISCDGDCIAPAEQCPSGSNRSYDECDGCGGCSSGFIDCDGQCTSAARPSTCAAPDVWDACTGCFAYVQISPLQAQIGFVHVRDDVRLATGNLRLEGTADGQGDIVLNSGKAIQIISGATDEVGRLNVGTWQGRQAQMVLHTSGGDQISEIVLSHGAGAFDATSRWALSLRANDNFEVWRNRSGWGESALLSIDYRTGAINIGNALTVEGDVTITEGGTLTADSATIGGVEIRSGEVGGVNLENVLTEIDVGDGLTVSGTDSSRTISLGDTVVTRPGDCGTNELLQWNGTAWECAPPSEGGLAEESDPLHRDWLDAPNLTNQLTLNLPTDVSNQGIRLRALNNPRISVIDRTNGTTLTMMAGDSRTDIGASGGPLIFSSSTINADGIRVDGTMSLNSAGNIIATGNLILYTDGATVDGVDLDTVLTRPADICGEGQALTWNGTVLECTTAGEVYTGAGNIQISPTNVITTVASPIFDGLTVGALADAANHVRVRTSSTGLADIIFTQGAADRWATALRPASDGRHFQILRTLSNGDWVPALTVDYATGEVRTARDMRIAGTAVIADRLSARDTTINGALTISGGPLNVPSRSTVPTNPPTGAIYWSTVEDNTGLRVYDGSGWRPVEGIVDEQDPLFTPWSERATPELRGLAIVPGRGQSAAQILFGSGAGRWRFDIPTLSGDAAFNDFRLFRIRPTTVTTALGFEYASGRATFESGATFGGDTAVSGALSVTRGLTVGGRLDVRGAGLTLPSLTGPPPATAALLDHGLLYWNLADEDAGTGLRVWNGSAWNTIPAVPATCPNTAYLRRTADGWTCEGVVERDRTFTDWRGADVGAQALSTLSIVPALGQLAAQINLGGTAGDRWRLNVPISGDAAVNEFRLLRVQPTTVTTALGFEYDTGAATFEAGASFGGDTLISGALSVSRGVTVRGRLDVRGAGLTLPSLNGAPPATAVFSDHGMLYWNLIGESEGTGLRVWNGTVWDTIPTVSTACPDSTYLRRTADGWTCSGVVEFDRVFTAWRGNPDLGVQTLATLTVGATDAAGSHLTVRASDSGVADLLLRQGTTDRWAVSVRPTTEGARSSDFEILRQADGIWDTVIGADYDTGAVTLDGDTTVRGNLTSTGNLTVSGTARLGTASTQIITVAGRLNVDGDGLALPVRNTPPVVQPLRAGMLYWDTSARATENLRVYSGLGSTWHQVRLGPEVDPTFSTWRDRTQTLTNLTVSQNLTTNSLTVTGEFNAATLDLSADLAVDGNAIVNGDLEVGGALTVGGAAVLTGASTVNWSQLGGFPACPVAGQFVTAIGGTLTCAAPPVAEVPAESDPLHGDWLSAPALSSQLTVTLPDTALNEGIVLRGAVNPRLRIFDNTNNVESYLQSTDLWAQIGTVSAHPVRLMTGNLARATLTNEGRFGIGTTAPAEVLHVVNPDGAAAIRIDGRTPSNQIQNGRVAVGHFTAGQAPIFAFGATGTANDNIAQFGGGSSLYNTATRLSFYTAGNSTTRGAGADPDPLERMRIDSQGRVGIGTTTPNNRLDVAGNIELSGGPGTGLLGRDTDFTYLQVAQGDWHHRFYTRTNVGAAAERFRIEGGNVVSNILFLDSNVGIGTSTPGTLSNTNQASWPSYTVADQVMSIADTDGDPVLELSSPVAGAGDRVGSIFFTNPGGQADAHRQIAGLWAERDGYAGNNNLAGGRLRFMTKVGGDGIQQVMLFDERGQLGIGTASPSQRLDVAGNIRAIGSIILPTAGATVDGVDLDTVLTGLTAGRNIEISDADAIAVAGSPTFDGLTVGALGASASHLTVRASDSGVADLLLRQGDSDRWAVSVRPTTEGVARSRDFEILRRQGADGPWDTVIGADYDTGAVTTTGNLGLGTTTPAERLDIEGNIRLTGTINGIEIAGLATIPPACSDGVRLVRWSDVDRAWRCVESFSDLTIEGNLTVHNELSVGGPLRLVEDGFLVLSSATNERERGAAFQDHLRTVVGAGALFYNSDDDVLRLLTDEGNFVSITPGAGGGGGGIDGSGTAGRIARFTGAETLGNSIISETGDIISVAGDLTATGDISADGCFGAVYEQPSALAQNGSRGGYVNANAQCPADMHICSTSEVLETIQCGAFAGKDTNGGAAMWINNLAPSLPTPTNDCGGWGTASSASVGVVYSFTSAGGVGGTASCDQSLRFACCQ